MVRQGASTRMLVGAALDEYRRARASAAYPGESARGNRGRSNVTGGAALIGQT
jgi:hypothetical protein